MNKKKILILSSLFLSLLFDCSRRPKPDAKELVFRGETMGTTYTVKMLIPLTMEKVNKYKEGIDKILANVNAEMSTYMPDSTISTFNQKKTTDWQVVSEELALVTKASLKLYQESQGFYDPTLGPVVNLWGFGHRDKKTRPPSSQEIKLALASTGGDKLHVEIGEKFRMKKDVVDLELDLSSIAKGRGVDLVSKYLKSSGFTNHMVEIGGEVRTSGKNMNQTPWFIGIRVPSDKYVRLQTVLEVSGLSVATSGDYENYFSYSGKKYSHIIHPKTGESIERRTASVSVVHASCMLADGYATTLMAMDYEKAYAFAKEKRLEALFILEDGEGGFQTKTVGGLEKRMKKLEPGKGFQ